MKFRIVRYIHEYYYIILNGKNGRMIYDIEIANAIGISVKRVLRKIFLLLKISGTYIFNVFKHMKGIDII